MIDSIRCRNTRARVDARLEEQESIASHLLQVHDPPLLNGMQCTGPAQLPSKTQRVFRSHELLNKLKALLVDAHETTNVCQPDPSAA